MARVTWPSLFQGHPSHHNSAFRAHGLGAWPYVFIGGGDILCTYGHKSVGRERRGISDRERAEIRWDRSSRHQQNRNCEV